MKNSRTQTPDNDDAPITVVVKRRPKAGKVAEFEDYIKGITQTAMKQPGHLGANIFKPEKAGGEYQLIFKFDSQKNYEAWEKSPHREAWLEKAKEVTDGADYRETISGLETWFTLPGEKSVVPPAKHKMSVVIWLSIFPIITLLSAILRPLLQDFPLVVQTATMTLIAVPIMTYVAMPRMTQWFKNWLHSGQQ